MILTPTLVEDIKGLVQQNSTSDPSEQAIYDAGSNLVLTIASVLNSPKDDNHKIYQIALRVGAICGDAVTQLKEQQKENNNNVHQPKSSY